MFRASILTRLDDGEVSDELPLRALVLEEGEPFDPIVISEKMGFWNNWMPVFRVFEARDLGLPIARVGLRVAVTVTTAELMLRLRKEDLAAKFDYEVKDLFLKTKEGEVLFVVKPENRKDLIDEYLGR